MGAYWFVGDITDPVFKVVGGRNDCVVCDVVVVAAVELLFLLAHTSELPIIGVEVGLLRDWHLSHFYFKQKN